jgi:hypothetical protein
VGIVKVTQGETMRITRLALASVYVGDVDAAARAALWIADTTPTVRYDIILEQSTRVT